MNVSLILVYHVRFVIKRLNVLGSKKGRFRKLILISMKKQVNALLIYENNAQFLILRILIYAKEL